MGTLSKLLYSIQSAPSVEQLKLIFMDQAEEALGADMHALYLFEAETYHPTEIYIRHLSESFVVEYEQLGREERSFVQMIQTRKATSDTKAYPGGAWKRSELYRINKKHRMRHYLAAPILFGSKIVGMINIGRKNETAIFNRADGTRLESLGKLIGTRLANLSRSNSESLPLGETDFEKFGCLRAVRALLRTRLEQWERESPPLSFEQALSYWRELFENRTVPVDFFDLEQRRYILVRPEPAKTKMKKLTDRELEILNRVAAGDSNKTIAFDMGLSISTVASHLSSAMMKLGVHSRVQLIEAAWRHYLVSTPDFKSI